MSDGRRPAPARGRPRDAGRDIAILEATLLVLTEVGYDQLTIDAVAARAGVGKPTVYRRYPGKAALVAAAVEHRAPGTPPATPPGNLRAALLATVQWLADQIAEQEIGLLGALFTGMRSDPRLAAEMRRILRRDEAAMTEQPFRNAIESGERLAPDAAALFAEIAPAVIVHRLIVAGQPCDRPFLEHLVDDVLLPLLQRR
ncbi:TetR/AcrR family transcriptional regulator [Microbispora sp. KK1-11]|uniref:TetR/AcrR family transcriptional regulator n=1 Tax=Microbispora sp. KK1-11 TaxID=2053005 RepID=UPI00115895A7|nr:TetR/AcrR family transcriptional regulator [Microbispora sp. KK1-11]TQS22287.1 TetR/AcrR family transcriptional regulator [Microbispora sp. KK1-11]